MIKRLVFVLAFSGVMTFNLFAQSDTIIGFSFADTLDTEFNADLGLSVNLAYGILAEDSSGTVRTLTYTNGTTGYAATASGWDEGANNKFWSVEFKADGYHGFVLYSKQRSGGTNSGPKNWKVQCKLAGGTYEDVPGGAVTVGNNWTTGVVDSLPLPATINDPGNTSVYVRWIMTDNVNAGGGTVAATGISKIDDIVITGIGTTGDETVIFENNVSVYPNPCNDILNVYSSRKISEMEIVDLQGRVVYEYTEMLNEKAIDIKGLTEGVYMLRIYNKDETELLSCKVFVLQVVF